MKKILIIGSGKSGRAAEKLLQGKAETYIWDDNMPLEKKPDVADYDEVLLSPGVSVFHPMPEEAKRLGKKVTGELELAYENCKGEFIAITGTNGKTTTTSLVGEIFKAAGYDTRVVGNIGNPVSEECVSANADSKMITEVSSFQLETVSDFHAHVSAILNITPDHLDRHGDMDNYAAVKARIAINQTEKDFFIYNAEDVRCSAIAKSLDGPKLIPFSLKADLPFEICDIQMPGDHNKENALAAAAICTAAGISREIILKTIAGFKGVEHRMEFVKEINGVKYINDSKGTNPDSTIKAVDSYDHGIILIAGGYDKHSDFKELISHFGSKVEYILCLGVTGPKFAQQSAEMGFDKEKIFMCKDLDECVRRAYKLAKPGDVVLLSPACASWDMYRSFEERGRHFKDLVNKL